MARDSILLDKSLRFAERIVKLHKFLIKEKHETIISKQIINELISLKNSIILINDTIWKEQYELKDIVMVEDTILDCADFDLMYGYFGENNGELLTLKEVNNKIMKYIKHFYKGNKIDLINDINKHSL